MSGIHPHLTRQAALSVARSLLERDGIDAGPEDARFLVLDALGLTQTELRLAPDAAIGEAGAARLARAMERRLSGEPVARILGAWEFWGLPFLLSLETLVPRPDTETLVETALRGLADRGHALRILDLGTGSGCVLIALLSECRHAFGIGVDRSAHALVTASANARANGVGDRCAFVAASWSDPLTGPFDVIVSNPPYIASAVIPALSASVRDHDPVLALDGGVDGLDAYRSILDGIAAGDASLLAGDGALHVEIGFDQAQAVADLGRRAGFEHVHVVRDLAGHERVVSLSGLRT
ncbi:protein-(glutamine-N5) methyltransferase, release factor-specific [Methylobacterium sp. Leaf466]|nr:protein-(glutamine-N5) methyltransferase, release factor-specific [Methylobacterium sp. Leaf466]